MTVHRSANGSRTVVTKRANGGRLVSTGGHRGYAERGFTRGGHRYMGRTYYDHGHYYARAYRGYGWRGGYYYGYAPGYYYGAGFYGWAYNPWAAPVAWGWGWGGAPWYGYYGYYFNPYPVYASPAFWVTDYLIAANLQAAYEARAAAVAEANSGGNPAGYNPGDDDSGGGGGGGGSTAVVLTPEVKQAIADEVKAQIAAEKAAAATSQSASAANESDEKVPAALDPNTRTFIVATDLAESLDDGTECTLTSGDVLTRIQDEPDENKNVRVLVSGSQKGDCQSGAQIAVAVDDLQEMHNHFAEQIDEGLGKLAENQGKNGMPASPATTRREVADAKAEPDLTVGADIDKADKDAAVAEADARQAAADDSQGGDDD
jgi:hypothetical protein